MDVEHLTDYIKEGVVNSEIFDRTDKVQHKEQVAKSLQQEPSFRRFKRSDDGPSWEGKCEIVKAVGGGDCFFDSVVKSFKQIRANEELTVKTLRELCHKYALKNEWVKTSVVDDARRNANDNFHPITNLKDDDIWNAYLLCIHYTAEDVEKMKSSDKVLHEKLTDFSYGDTLRVPIWGRGEIEGRMICEEYGVKLHISERHIVEGKELWIDQIIDKSGSKSVESIDYGGSDVIHIVNKGSQHFDSLLVKQGIRHLEQRPSDYDDKMTPEEELVDVVKSSDSEEEKLIKIKKLFEREPKPNINFQGGGNDKSLHIAFRKNEIEVVKLLAKNEPKIDIKNDKSNGPHNRQKVPGKKVKFSSQEYSKSGLVHTLHGDIYQLKLLMLFVKRGLDRGYIFKLATEMDAAEKFDDLVFQCEKNNADGIEEMGKRFLQAKHKQNQEKMISVNDLLTQTNGEFSLQKYFSSYCKVQQNPELKFENNRLEYGDFVICTNIGFKFDDKKGDLKLSEDIFDSEIDKSDIFDTRLFKFQKSFTGKEQIVSVLRNAPDLTKLAKRLAECVLDGKSINDPEGNLFKSYQGALIDKVIDKTSHKLSVDFVKGLQLSSKTKNLRVAFEKVFYDRRKSFNLDDGPTIQSLEVFAHEVADLILKSKADKIVKVEKRKSVIKNDFDRLAGYVLVKKDGKVQFSSAFLDVNNKLPGNLNDFRDVLYKKLEDLKFDKGSLDQYQFNVYKDFKTCEEIYIDKDTFWEKIGEKRLKLFENFGKLDTNLQSIGQFVKQFVALLEESESKGDRVVKIKRAYSIISKNIGKLAPHILIEKDNKIQFSSEFFSDTQLPGNLNDFRSQLKAKLKELDFDFNVLKKYEFYISNFPKCDLPSGDIDQIESDIEGFLSHLKFAVNQPNEMELSDIIKEELGKEFNDIDGKNVYGRFLEKMLDWMKAKEGVYFSSEDAKEFFETIKREILGPVWFELRDPVFSFYGREKELIDLHSNIQSSEKIALISQMTSISGLGGIGKTELARKYAKKYSSYYNNVVWINAGSSTEFTQSFLRLAQDDRVGINLYYTEGEKKSIKKIVEDVYSFFARKESLFIFDNADNVEYLKDFLPLYSPGPSRNRPYILITSRNRNWESGIKKIELAGLSLGDAFGFIKNGLEINDDSQDQDIKELLQELQFFPLALQQAIAYIIDQKSGKISINDYLNEYRKKQKELLNSRLFIDARIDNSYTRTTFETWKVTIDKIANDENYGRLASEILDVIAYLGSENIPRKMFLSLAENDEDKLGNAVKLLVKYCMVNGEKEQSVLNVHRLVQEVVRLQLDDQGRTKEVIKKTYELLKDVFPADIEGAKDYSSIEFFLLHPETLLSHIDSWIASNPQYQEEMSQNFLEPLLILLGEEYFEIYDLEGAVNCFKRVLEIKKAYYIKDSTDVVEITIKLGEVYKVSKKYAEQEKILSEIEGTVKRIYQSDSFELGEFLVDLGRVRQRLNYHDKENVKNLLEEGFSILEKAYTIRDNSRLELGEVLMDLSQAYESLLDYNKQIETLYKALKIVSPAYGSDSFEVAKVQVKLAGAYVKLMKYSKARIHIIQATKSPSLYRTDHSGVSELLAEINQYNLYWDSDEDEAEVDAESDYMQDVFYSLESGSIEQAEWLILMSRNSHESVSALRCDQVLDAIGIFKRYYEEGTVKLAQARLDLANAYCGIHEYSAQEKLIKESVLPVLEKKFNNNAIEIAQAQFSLAKAYEGLEKYEDQVELLTKVLPIFCYYFGDRSFEVAEVQFDLAINYKQSGKYLEQIMLIEKYVLPVFKEQFPLRAVKVLVVLGEAYQCAGNDQKKADYLHEALTLYKALKGLPHPSKNSSLLFAEIALNLSETYGKLKKRQERLVYLIEASKILLRQGNPFHEKNIEIVVRLIKAYRELSLHDEANKLLNELLPDADHQTIEDLVAYYAGPRISLQCSKKGRRILESLSSENSSGKKRRKERSIGMACVDSLDDEKVTNDEKERRVRELFNTHHRMGGVKDAKEFYDQLFTLSERISRGETTDIEEELFAEIFVAGIKNMDLNSIDPEIRDIVKKMQDNLRKKGGIKNVLGRSGIAEKIGKVAEGAGLTFTAFLIGKHIASGNIEELGYDALNLWIMPKFGEKISGKILELGTKLDSQILKGFAPVAGRAIGNFAAFLGLAESIKARQDATDPVDIKISNLNIVTNSIFIAADVPVVITETMSTIGMEVGEIGEFTGPVGAFVSVTSLITSQFVEAGLRVEKLTEQINLTDQEEHDAYWSFFLDMKMSDNIQYDLEAKQVCTQYVSKLTDQFRNTYNGIGISLPSISTNKVAELRCYSGQCMSSTEAISRKLVPQNTTFISIEQFAKYGWSRLIPTIENYEVICAPLDEDITAKVSDQSTQNERSIFSGSGYLTNITTVLSFEKYPDHCNNAVIYKGTNSSSNYKDIYFITSRSAHIKVNYKDNIDVIFYGSAISVSSDQSINEGTINRYHFSQPQAACTISKPGRNFFYVIGNDFSCHFEKVDQNNIVVTQGNFTDSKSIVHSIVGSSKTNHIEVSYANYVDGRGGNDVIIANKSTVIKGYFGDSIYGNGLVVLPINASEIDKIIATDNNNRMNVYNKSKQYISLDRRTLMKTADGFFVTPIKVEDKTGVVTNLHLMKIVLSDIRLDDELDNLQKIDSSNFNVTKQLFGPNCHVTIGSDDGYVFYPDEDGHNFYWEAPRNVRHFYLFDERNANITIAKANGILDFSQLNSTLSHVPCVKNKEGEIKINKNGLYVTLLPDYKDVTVTFNREEYYKLQDGKLERDYCSHSLKIDGRFFVNGTDLLNHYNCFTFDSDKVLFLKTNIDNDLLLLSDKRGLLISDYYSSFNRTWNLSIALNSEVIEPKEFRERARAGDFSFLSYYQPDERGLQVYHNQPINKNNIGLVDFSNKSILDFDMEVINNSLVLSHKNNTLTKVENWGIVQAARKVMFVFNDMIVSNSRCIVSTCNSEDTVVEFNKEKAVLLTKHLFNAVKQGNLDEVKNLVNRDANINDKDKEGKTPLDIARDKGDVNIVEYLEQKVNQERRGHIQRRRRHHNGEHYHDRHHLSRKLLAIGSINQPEIAASSSERPSSWINNLFSWVNSSIGWLLDSKPALPEGVSNTTSLISQINAPMDINGTIMLLDLLIRKVTGQKYISTVDQSISLLEAQGYALNITYRLKEIIEQAAKGSGISMHRLNIDFVGMQKEVTGKIMSSKFNEISGVLNSYVEKACPSREAGCPGKLSPKKFDKFMTMFDNKLDIALNQSIQQILHGGDGKLEVRGAEKQQMSLEPQSYLSNASVQGHLTRNKVKLIS